MDKKLPPKKLDAATKRIAAITEALEFRDKTIASIDQHYESSYAALIAAETINPDDLCKLNMHHREARDKIRREFTEAVRKAVQGVSE